VSKIVAGPCSTAQRACSDARVPRKKSISSSLPSAAAIFSIAPATDWPITESPAIESSWSPIRSSAWRSAAPPGVRASTYGQRSDRSHPKSMPVVLSRVTVTRRGSFTDSWMLALSAGSLSVTAARGGAAGRQPKLVRPGPGTLNASAAHAMVFAIDMLNFFFFFFG